MTFDPPSWQVVGGHCCIPVLYLLDSNSIIARTNRCNRRELQHDADPVTNVRFPISISLEVLEDIWVGFVGIAAISNCNFVPSIWQILRHKTLRLQAIIRQVE
jgi:hypothetical protein